MAGEMDQQPDQAVDDTQAQGGEQDQAVQLVQNGSKALSMVTDLLNSVSPELGQAMDQLNDQYKAIIEKAMASAGGGQAPEQGQSGGMSSPQAAGAASARPVMAKGY